MLLAIDPGGSGGIACCGDDGSRAACWSMPKTEADVVHEIELSASRCDYDRRLDERDVAYIETMIRHIPTGKPKVAVVDGVAGLIGGGAAASNAIMYGRSCGIIHGALLALGVRIIEVRPQQWTKLLGLGTSGATKEMTSQQRSKLKTAWKNKLKGEAQRRFPGLKVTLATADALLILEYARMMERR